MILEKELTVKKCEETPQASKPFKIHYFEQVDFEGEIYQVPSRAGSLVKLEVGKTYQLYVKVWNMNNRMGISIESIKYQHQQKK